MLTLAVLIVLLGFTLLTNDFASFFDHVFELG